MDDQSPPPKIRLEHTPLKRMNTVSGAAGRSERRKHSSVAALYTPQDHLKTQQPQVGGYRRLSIGSKASPLSAQSTGAAAKKRISGINFNIPVVTADKDSTAIRSSSSSPQQQSSPTLLERPSSIDSMPSPSPVGHIRSESGENAVTLDVPTTPTQKHMDTPTTTTVEDGLSSQLRELAAKEAELLEIKETIKNLVNKKRTMEMEFEVLKKSVERSLHQQINPTTTTRKSYPQLPSPKNMRSPIKSFQQKQHHRTVSDHPLDDNFNSITPSSSHALAATASARHSQNTGQDNKKNASLNRRQSGLWGIITQVDNYIQNEFEKFNIIDANPANDDHHQEQELNESYYAISNDQNIPSEENRIKKLLDSNNGIQLPQSLRNVVDTVIYGPSSTIKEEDESISSPVSGVDVVKGNSKKSVEMKDFSTKRRKDKKVDDDEWSNDFNFND